MRLKKILVWVVAAVVLCLAENGYSGTRTFTYDKLNRLIQEVWPDGTVIGYTYDATGNRLGADVVAPSGDSDGDGLPNGIEQTGCTSLFDADTDDDGIPDAIEDANHNGIVNAGETNPCIVDTDGDGIQDGTEMGYTLAMIGPDTDTAVFRPDLDPETITNPLSVDSDGDGLTDGNEDVNFNGRVDSGEQNPSCDYFLHDQTLTAGTVKSYVAGCSITAGPAYVIQSGAQVTLQAGTTVTLKPGFRADQGSTFHALIQ
jgi:YD repeat-containing protein